MKQFEYYTEFCETEGKITWRVSMLLVEGESEVWPDAIEESESATQSALERYKEMVSLIPGTMAPNTNPEVVPTPLTTAQREQLYKLVYGECTKHVWPTGLDLLTILHNK